jgi:ATP-dependent DNA ligase
MTSTVPELERLPGGLVLDGELVAFDERGQLHYPRLTRRVRTATAACPCA